MILILLISICYAAHHTLNGTLWGVLDEPLAGIDVKLGDQIYTTTAKGTYQFDTDLKYFTLEVSNKVNLFKPLKVDMTRLATNEDGTLQAP